MFEKNLRMSYLVDFYGEALDSHTRQIMSAYYDDDLSLGEIAAEEGISRQGVRHIIKRGEEQLLFFEERLGLAAQHERLSLLTGELVALKERLAGSQDTDGADLIDRLIEEITNKGL